ncbi:hypothetical protein [uncultured Jannaschia sp.]|uniref:hypothetical protein n=1 Tax=uncultured Jannaschia sp. TaxID=293347 RepID=UPI002601729A|nr:hypothetical protein [uncultured Jannaschia sp.]
MSLTEELADKLAARVIAHVEKTGDEDVVALLSRSLDDTCQTLRDAFHTSLRVQRAALRADRLLAERMAGFDDRHPSQDTAARPVPPDVG